MLLKASLADGPDPFSKQDGYSRGENQKWRNGETLSPELRRPTK
jgi:hypothetical protein